MTLDPADIRRLLDAFEKSDWDEIRLSADGVEVFLDAGILYAPGKAANAGGVAVSGLEQSQNSLRISWSRGEVDARHEAGEKDVFA